MNFDSNGRFAQLAALLFFTLVPLVAADCPRICTDYTIPVNPTSVNLLWAKPFANNYDVVDFLTDLTSSHPASSPFVGAKAQTASYQISATFCTPKNSTSKNNIVLLLTHGVNFDRRYWDPSISPEKYSFVDWAITKGYSVFFYDRLGVGKSSVVSGFVNQASIQEAILTELATAVKSGNYTGSTGKPKSLVLVGHSFGSAVTNSVVRDSPTLADGLILTGFNFNGSANRGASTFETFAPRIASGQDPKWKALDNGYLALIDIFANVNVFFKAPDYDVNVVEYAQSIQQPFGINEVISSGAINTTTTAFKGPTMLISGQFDYIFCDGLCDGVLQDPAQEVFTNAKAFKAVSYPGAGHGLNLAANATGAFQIITDFLGENGL
ncbi:alpha/beta-hydrolase [Stipitochalara longipes BDJ]|nr:alpha/beta-hydrolase [Stipitochalara longipes BDJ]